MYALAQPERELKIGDGVKKVRRNIGLWQYEQRVPRWRDILARRELYRQEMARMASWSPPDGSSVFEQAVTRLQERAGITPDDDDDDMPF